MERCTIIKVTFNKTLNQSLLYSDDKEPKKKDRSLQCQTSYGKLNNNEIFTCFMLLRLAKGKNDYKPFTAQQYLAQFQSLLTLLQESDPTLSLLPIDELAEDQTELKTIPPDLPSIWNKQLFPYINSKHCTYGNRATHQSFGIRV